MYEPQSDFQDWCTANLGQIAFSKEIRMLLAQAFEGGRVAEREACAKVCDEMEQRAEGTECCKWPTPADCAAAIRGK